MTSFLVGTTKVSFINSKIYARATVSSLTTSLALIIASYSAIRRHPGQRFTRK